MLTTYCHVIFVRTVEFVYDATGGVTSNKKKAKSAKKLPIAVPRQPLHQRFHQKPEDGRSTREIVTGT